MSVHSDLPYTLSSGSPLPSLRVPATRMGAPQSLEVNSRKVTSSLKTKRVKISAQSRSQRRTNYATVNLLPDELLLDIFDHIRHATIYFEIRHIPATRWQVLVHVCRRWRQIVFASPRRLDLQLLCTYGTPVRKYLACWPAFPIVVEYDYGGRPSPNIEDNVISVLKHHRRRIRQIKLTISSSLWRKMTTVMRKPFPALTSLSISTVDGNVPSIPRGFLGGSAPCLRSIQFHGIPTPAIPTLLSYTSDLVELNIFDRDTPRTDFISPAALVARLAMLPRLKILHITLPWTSQLDHWQINLPPQTRVVLPALTSFSFDGERTYLEDFVAQFDTPRLDSIDVKFLDLPDTRIPQLFEFINRSGLKQSRFEDARIYIDNHDTIFKFIDLNHLLDQAPISIRISSYEKINNNVWCMAQVLRQTSAFLSNVGRLEIESAGRWPPEEEEGISDIDWLELLRPFTAVESLHVCPKFAKSIVRALGGMPTETDNQLLPALNLLFLEGEPTTSIDHLFAALQSRERPLTITIQRARFERW